MGTECLSHSLTWPYYLSLHHGINMCCESQLIIFQIFMEMDIQKNHIMLTHAAKNVLCRGNDKVRTKSKYEYNVFAQKL